MIKLKLISSVDRAVDSHERGRSSNPSGVNEAERKSSRNKQSDKESKNVSEMKYEGVVVEQKKHTKRRGRRK